MNHQSSLIFALVLWLSGISPLPAVLAGPVEQRPLDLLLAAEARLQKPVEHAEQALGPASPVSSWGSEEPSLFGRLDLLRIRELHHLAELFGEEIWPGFDMRRIPIAVNAQDKQELLVAHPRPPEAFRPFGTLPPDGVPLMIRDGVTRYGPDNGGWAVQLGGRKTAYVSTMGKDRASEGYYTLLTHECFHCFQDTVREEADGASGEFPEDDPSYSAKLGLESRVLKSALEQTSRSRASQLARMFVAVRRDRRREMPRPLVLLEGEQEYSEGTATYSATRLLQLLARAEGFMPLPDNDDPQYGAFRDAQARYEETLADILPPPETLVSFLHAMYSHGMAQALLLDELRPGWKREMREKGSTQFGLLERQFPLTDSEEKSLLALARRRFDYDGLLAEQTRLVEANLNTIRSFLFAKGRRYRLRFLDKRFNWKPLGPVHSIPRSIEEELVAAGNQSEVQSDRMVWAGGISRFEQAGFTFAAGPQPNVFGNECIEWIDRNPAPDRSDLVVEAEVVQGDTVFGATIKTSGFVIKAAKMRIQWTAQEVLLEALPAE